MIVDGSGVVKERNDYYPFGARQARGDYLQRNGNRYKYNGKEEQVTGGLDYLDYGWRMLDKSLGRWFGMDKLSEMMPSVSGYAYGLNNPVNYRDLYGLFPRKKDLPVEHVLLDEVLVTAQGNYTTGSSSSSNWYYPGLEPTWDGVPDWDELARRGREVWESRQDTISRFLSDLSRNDQSLKSSQEGLNQERYNLLASLNTGLGAVNYWNGMNEHVMKYAVRSSFKSARTYGEFSRLRPAQQTWRMNSVLGKSGMNYLKTVRGLGYVGGFASVGITVYNTTTFYLNGGSGWEVGAKAFLDGAMVIVGFMGPLGFCISTTYFLLDMSTNGFGGFGSIDK